MPLGPEPAFATMSMWAADRAAEANSGRPTKQGLSATMSALLDVALAGCDLAQAASDLLYVLENDAPDSERIDRAIRAVRDAMAPKCLERYAATTPE